MARPAQKLAAVAVLVVALLVTGGGTAVQAGAVSCRQVVGYLTPCISYAIGAAPEPGQACCAGIKTLAAAAKTGDERRDTCACIKQAVSSMGALKPDLVAGIPSKCGVSIPYPISRDIDCSKVQ